MPRHGTGSSEAFAPAGCLNFRDLAWLRAFAHVGLVPGRIYRSDSLTWCSAGGLALLERRLGIQSVIDLRSGLEASHAPLMSASWRYVRIPIVENPLRSSAVAMARAGISIADGYMRILIDGAAGIRQAFEWIADEDHLPLILFCTAGKDRTGILAALLLANAGIPADAIACDYEKSSSSLTAQRRRSGLSPADIAAIPPAARYSYASTMREFLDAINERWGSSADYLRRIGLSESVLDSVRGRLVAGSASAVQRNPELCIVDESSAAAGGQNSMGGEGFGWMSGGPLPGRLDAMTAGDENCRSIPCSADVNRARSWLADRVHYTPVIRSYELDLLAGMRVWLKAENLQIGGSFKRRGALMAVGRLAASGYHGVVAQSTGNHAIAVAMAARELGLTAVIVLPQNAAAAKIQRIREAKAEVIFRGSSLDERLALVEELRQERGLGVVDPYEDPDVIAGQGTATAELIEQVRSLGARLDTLVIPVGGGSALAGACLAVNGQGIDVIAAEPAAVPSLSKALHAGHPVTVPCEVTIADGLRPNRIGRLPFMISRPILTDVRMVEEEGISEATFLALMYGKMLVEPAAATALAVAIRLKRDGKKPRKDIGVIITGGNVESSLLMSVLASHGANSISSMVVG